MSYSSDQVYSSSSLDHIDLNYYSQSAGSQFQYANTGTGAGAGSTSDSFSSSASVSSGPVDYDSEPPLLSELGIDGSLIYRRSIEILFPNRSASASANSTESAHSEGEESDLAGPLCFCLLLGIFLLMCGKIHFGYIYGFGLIGCVIIYLILNLLSPVQSVSFDSTMSILGYSILPLVILSAVNVGLNLNSSLGGALSFLSILWSTISSTKKFEKFLNMKNQRFLIAYPIMMLYAVFALLTIF